MLDSAAANQGCVAAASGWSSPAAFAALYEEHVGRIYRHVFYLVGSKAEAEDLTSQTFLQAWKAIGRYQDRGQPILSWLLTIAHNLVVTKWRNGHKQTTLDGYIPSTDTYVQPEQAYIAEYESREIQAAILRLKPLERQVILLRFVEGMDYPETAQTLGKTVNAIRVLQYRALRSLRQVMSGDGGG